MERDVFTDEFVSDFLNSKVNFVKVDVLSDSGKAIAKSHMVNFQPYFILQDDDEEELLRFGYSNLQEFTDFINNMPLYIETYKNKEPITLRDAILKYEILKSGRNLSKDMWRSMLASIPPDSLGIKFFRDFYLNNLVLMFNEFYVEDVSSKQFQAFLKHYNQQDPEDRDLRALKRIIFCFNNKLSKETDVEEYNKLRLLLSNYLEQYGDDAVELKDKYGNVFCWLSLNYLLERNDLFFSARNNFELFNEKERVYWLAIRDDSQYLTFQLESYAYVERLEEWQLELALKASDRLVDLGLFREGYYFGAIFKCQAGYKERSLEALEKYKALFSDKSSVDDLSIKLRDCQTQVVEE